MKKGDSFIIGKPSRSGIYTAARLGKVKVAVRKVDAWNVRVWRTS